MRAIYLKKRVVLAQDLSHALALSLALAQDQELRQSPRGSGIPQAECASQAWVLVLL
jgi:hypothetical protein